MSVCGNDREAYLSALRAALDRPLSDSMHEHVIAETARVASDLAMFATARTAPPLWRCDCGARNPLHRDRCLHCRASAPEWKEDERYDEPERRS